MLIFNVYQVDHSFEAVVELDLSFELQLTLSQHGCWVELHQRLLIVDAVDFLDNNLCGVTLLPWLRDVLVELNCVVVWDKMAHFQTRLIGREK